jgi:hypothetical protein
MFGRKKEEWQKYKKLGKCVGYPRKKGKNGVKTG